MIQEFSVENTYSIREKQTLKFVADVEAHNSHVAEIDGRKLLKICGIYGANASGKSNMLRSLNFYLHFMATSFMRLSPSESTNFVPFRFDDECKNLPGKFSVVFYIKDDFVEDDMHSKYTRYEYDLHIKTSGVVYEALRYAPKGQLKLIFERKVFGSGYEIVWGSEILGQKKIIADITRPNCSVISAGAQVHHPVFTKVYGYLLSRLGDVITPSFDSIHNDVLERIYSDRLFKERMIGILNASDLGNVVGIDIEARDLPHEIFNIYPNSNLENRPFNRKQKAYVASIIHRYRDKNYELPLAFESSGTIRMMDISYRLAELLECDKILIADEIEASLHQELLEAFLNMYLQVSKESQLFFATHNMELLESGILLDEEIWFCHKTESGNSVYKSVAQTRGKRKEQSRKKLYNEGMFGALPQVDLEKLVALFG